MILLNYHTVLNLIITGIPSIPSDKYLSNNSPLSFKPYYNWNTFNTRRKELDEATVKVLNLIITGIPSIRWDNGYTSIQKKVF